MIKKLLSFGLCAVIASQACTLALISGDITKDGRPVLWKNRDWSDIVGNEVKFFNDGIHHDGYVAITQSDTTYTSPDTTIDVITEAYHPKMGLNSHGFGIVNSFTESFLCDTKTSPVIHRPNEKKPEDVFLKKALRECATVSDFRKLVQTWEYGFIAGNYGVIDSTGAAYFFEVASYHNETPIYIEHNVNEHPEKFMAMANSYSKLIAFDTTYGQVEVDGQMVSDTMIEVSWVVDPATGEKVDNPHFNGCSRKSRAEYLIREAKANNTLDYSFVVTSLTRGGYLSDEFNLDETTQFGTSGLVTRNVTRSACVIHGVLQGEDPRLATFWAILGEPLFSVAVPVFAGAHSIPYQLEAPYNSYAPFLNLVLNNEMKCYDNNSAFFDAVKDTTITPYRLWHHEYNSNGDIVDPAIHSYTLPIEARVIAETEDFLAGMRLGFTPKRVDIFRTFEDKLMSDVYRWYSLRGIK